MPDRIRPANRAFYECLRHTLGAWLVMRLRPRYDTEVLKTVRPPYLLIGNHSSNWDAFLMGIPVKGPVHYVASDEFFRTPLLRFLFGLIGGIPKTKNTSDSSAVRAMLAVRKSGGVIGLYPEGNRNWDGVTGPLFSATAKLIKKFRIPVITVLSTGNSLTQPRWSRTIRSGPWFVDYKLLFAAEDCELLSEQEIAERMEQALAHDDQPDAAARTEAEGLPFRYKGNRLAERLELFLFQCPSCHATDTLASSGDRFSCKKCGLITCYGEDGKLHPVENTPGRTQPFSLTRDWNIWQCENLRETIRKREPYPNSNDVSGSRSASTPCALLENEDAFLQTGGNSGKLADFGTGLLQLHPEHLDFLDTTSGSPVKSFSLERISGLNIQYNNRFEFYYDDILYRFSFPQKTISVWKWHQAMIYAKDTLAAAHTGGVPQ